MLLLLGGFLLLMLLDVVVHQNEFHLRTPRREKDMNEIYCRKNIINDLVWREQNMLILVLALVKSDRFFYNKIYYFYLIFQRTCFQIYLNYLQTI